jgi:hypothetical protein
VLARDLESLDPGAWLLPEERAHIRDFVMREDLEGLAELVSTARFCFLALTDTDRVRRTAGSAVEFVERQLVAQRRRRAGWVYAAATKQPREAVALRFGLGWCRMP